MPKKKASKQRQPPRPHGARPHGAQKGVGVGRSWQKHLVWIIVAVLAQALLTLGYLRYTGSALDGALAEMVSSARRFSLPEAVCPDEWVECPRLPDVDWPALFALADAAAPAHIDRDLDRCEPTALLSPRPVPGMHLICVLPAPASPVGAAAMLLVYTNMERGRQPTLLYLPKGALEAETIGEQTAKRVAFITAMLEYRLSLRSASRPARWQRPGWFTATGIRIESVRGLLAQVESGGQPLNYYP